MSDPTSPLAPPEPEPEPEREPASEQPAPESEPEPHRPARAARLNALAVAALILALLLSPLAALFGHIAIGQINRSAGRERGLAVAWVAVGLGYLWLAGFLVMAVAIGVVLSR